MPYPALASVLAYSSTEFQRGTTKGKGGLLVLGSLFSSSQRFPSLKNFQPLPKVCTTYPEAVFLSNPQLHTQTQPSLGKGWEQVTKNDPDVVLSKPETLQPTQEFFPPRSFVQSCRLVHVQDKFNQKKRSAALLLTKLHHIVQATVQRRERKIKTGCPRGLTAAPHFLTALLPVSTPSSSPLLRAAVSEPGTTADRNRFATSQAAHWRHGLPLLTGTALRSRTHLHRANHFGEPSQAISIPKLPVSGVGH